MSESGCAKNGYVVPAFCRLFALQPDQWKFEIVAFRPLYKMNG